VCHVGNFHYNRNCHESKKDNEHCENGDACVNQALWVVHVVSSGGSSEMRVPLATGKSIEKLFIQGCLECVKVLHWSLF